MMKPNPWRAYRPRDERLRLALLKETKAYRDFWTNHGSKAFLDAWRKFKPQSQKAVETSQYKIIREFISGLWHFGICFNAGPYGEKVSAFVKLADPFSREELPEPLPFAVFRDVAPIAIVKVQGVPDEHQLSAPLETNLEPSERLLKVDLARPRGELLNEFKFFLDRVDHFKNFDDVPTGWKENYLKWVKDNSRLRTEIWRALEIWKLRRDHIPFPVIARRLKMKVSAVKEAFYHAYELIENEPYRPDFFKKYKAISAKELRRICGNCPERPTCKGLCPDVVAYYKQDEIESK